MNKDNWTETLISEIVEEVSERVDNPSKCGLERFVGLEDFEPGVLTIRRWSSSNNLVSAMKLFKVGDILFARRNAYLRRASKVDFDGICSGDAIVLRPKDLIENELIPLILNTNTFWEYAIANAAGTMSKRVKWRDLAKYAFMIPKTSEEQKQIISLFQSIVTAIEQVEYQEKNLQTLQNTLTNSLLEIIPHFGNLLNEDNISKIKFGEVADCIEQHDKEKRGVTRFVGLENIESGDFKIGTWGNISDGTTFTKRFKFGDILFGKRRSYLKKVAVADFEGICSGDILVFRAKMDAILPELLPYYVASDAFIQHAVTTSAGSLSPRTKWKDLKEFEFSIPDLKTQGMVLKVLNQIQILLEQFKEQKVTLKTIKQNLLNEILG